MQRTQPIRGLAAGAVHAPPDQPYARPITRWAALAATTALWQTGAAAQPEKLQAEVDRPIEEIVVTGDFITAQSIERRRTAANFRNVFDRSLLQRLPDQDLSEALDRIPGVTIQESSSRDFRSQFVVINGIPPELNNVTILGQEITSTLGDRAITLDVLPSSAASVLEVHKSFSPDLVGNFIGGQINLIPLSAFEFDDLHLQASLQGGVFDREGALDDPAFQPFQIDTPLQAKAEAASRFGPGGDFGIALGFEFFRDSQPQLLAQCDDWRFAAGEISTLPEDLQVCEGMRVENGVRNVRRFSGSAMLEYRPDADTHLYLSGILANQEEETSSLQNEWNFFDRLPGPDDPEQVELLGPGVLFNPSGRIDKETDEDVREEKFYFVVGGFSVGAGNFTVSGSASYNETDNRSTEFAIETRASNLGATTDFNERFPFAEPSDPARFNDPATHQFNFHNFQPQTNDTETVQAQIKTRYDASLGSAESYLEAGLKTRLRESVQDRDEFFQQEVEGGLFDGLSLADSGIAGAPLGVVLDPIDIKGTPLPIGPTINAVTMRELIEANPDQLVFDDLIRLVESDFAVDEDVTAGYVMGGLTWGELDIQAGVRVEHTSVDATVQSFNEVTATATPQQRSNEFTDAFPAVNLKYSPLDSLVVRGAFSQTIARANLRQIAGTQAVDFNPTDEIAPGVFTQGAVSEGNPELEPFEADNFDLGIEFYPGSGGLIALSGFYKDIANPIFRQTVTLTDFSAGGLLFQEAEVSRPLNGGSAELYGLTIDVRQTFDQLPGPFAGFGLDANLTLLDSEFEGVPGRPEQNFPLPGQSDIVASITPHYSYGPFEFALVWNFTDDQLVEILDAIPAQGVEEAGDGNFDIFQDDRSTLDFRASYRLFDRYTLFVSAENLTEEPRSFFEGRPENQGEFVKETTTWWFGLRTNF